MGAGIFLIMIGAILAFAVRKDTSAVDLQTVGIILILGGAALIWHAKNGSTTERETTTTEDVTHPGIKIRTTRESVTDEDPHDGRHLRH